MPKEEEPVNTQDGPIIPVPDGIRPVMKKHRIEVSCLVYLLGLDKQSESSSSVTIYDPGNVTNDSLGFHPV